MPKKSLVNQNEDNVIQSNYPSKKYTFVGAGVISYIALYYLWKTAHAQGERIRVTLVDKNKNAKGTTGVHIKPSLTDDEIVSVIPPAPVFKDKLSRLFNEPGGIRVDDVAGVNDSEVTREFLNAIEMYGLDPEGHQHRVKTLLELGHMSMNDWQEMYEQGDDEFKQIMILANFQPCREPRKEGDAGLHDGYRIDLIYKTDNALGKANSMCADYRGLGYQHCDVLTPAQVLERDPALADFCEQQTELNAAGERVWKKSATAVWRPGGCIDMKVFLPLLHEYLTKVMGKYINEEGVEKDCLRVRYDRNLEGVTYDQENRVNGLKFFGNNEVKHNKHAYPESNYGIFPGENVGSLKRAGFPEPEYARFAGASLVLKIPVPLDQIEKYRDFNHCMEVHQANNVVLAWQARYLEGNIEFGVAGTKAYYGDKEPQLNDDFAKDRHLLQLNAMNDVLPEFLSWALGRDTKGHKLTWNDLVTLEDAGIVERWVGSRGVAYDGFPTGGKIAENAVCITHAGSGGVSFGPGLVRTFFGLEKPEERELADAVRQYGNPQRSFR